MGFDGLPIFVVEHLQSIAKNEGFADGYDVKHESGSKAGDGFTSTLLSVKLIGYRRVKPTANLELNELALICKVQPSNVAHNECFNSDKLFQREVYVYTKLLPALAAFEKEHNISQEMTLTGYPKCYAAFHDNVSSESVIILEDLRAAGFQMWDKSMKMDFDSVRLVLEQIGRLHGLSIAMRYQKPDLFKEVQELPKHVLDIFLSPGVASMFTSAFSNAISVMDHPEDIAILEQLKKQVPEIMTDAIDEKLLGESGVISHGDCWINNMMFEYDNGFTKSISLLDWQTTRISSPAVDISNLILTATDKALRDVHIDEFLQIYYKNLANSIRATGSDPEVLYPEAELHRQMCRFGINGVMIAALFIPVMLADSSEIANINDVAETMVKGSEETVFLAKLTDTSKVNQFSQRMKDVLADARRYGWL